MKRPSLFTNMRLISSAVMATWGINVAIDQLAYEGTKRSPASGTEGIEVDVQIEKTTHQKLDELLAQWNPEQLAQFEQGLRAKVQVLIEKHGPKHQELQIEVKGRDLDKAEELKTKVTELQSTIAQDILALEEESKALQLAQDHAKFLEADLNRQLKTTSPEQLAEIQGDIQKIDVFSKLVLSTNLLSSAQGVKKQVDELLDQVEGMRQQVAQLDENQKLQDEVQSNKDTLETLRKELVELKCEKQRELKLVPAEEQESFLKDINESAQKLALLERTAITEYPQLQAPIGMIYDQYNLGGFNPASFGSYNQMNSPFFQWQNMALMNSWMQQAMAPYQSPMLYSQYGMFDGSSIYGQAGQSNTNMNWPGQSIYGNNNVVNYYLPYNNPSMMGLDMGRAPSANMAAPALNTSGVGVQLGQALHYQFNNFSGAPNAGTSTFGFNF